MKPNSIYVSGSAVGLLLDYMDHVGLDDARLRQKLEFLKEAPRFPVIAWWQVLSDLQAIHPVGGLGLQIGRHVKAHHVGILGYLAIFSDTLESSLNRFCRFQSLLHNFAPSRVVREADDVVIRWTPIHGFATLLSDEVMASGLLTLIHNCGSKSAKPTRIEFPHPAPSEASEYERYFECPVHFGREELAVSMPSDALITKIGTHDPHLMGVLEHQAKLVFDSLPDDDLLLKQVRHQLAMLLQDGNPEFSALAKRLGMANRTLYRFLQERGLRYTSILNDLRFQLARDYMGDAKLSLAEIALLLGFAEQSAFSRAFKEWSGQPPARYRRTRFFIGKV